MSFHKANIPKSRNRSWPAPQKPQPCPLPATSLISKTMVYFSLYLSGKLKEYVLLLLNYVCEIYPLCCLKIVHSYCWIASQCINTSQFKISASLALLGTWVVCTWLVKERKNNLQIIAPKVRQASEAELQNKLSMRVIHVELWINGLWDVRGKF